MTFKWALFSIGAVLATSSLLLFVFQYFGEDSGDANSPRFEVKEFVSEGHQLWDEGSNIEAIKTYKKVLRHEMRQRVFIELPIIYRRVIEHESNYGDPGEARDWCFRAIQDSVDKLTFESEKAKSTWIEVRDSFAKNPGDF